MSAENEQNEGEDVVINQEVNRFSFHDRSRCHIRLFYPSLSQQRHGWIADCIKHFNAINKRIRSVIDVGTSQGYLLRTLKAVECLEYLCGIDIDTECLMKAKSLLEPESNDLVLSFCRRCIKTLNLMLVKFNFSWTIMKSNIDVLCQNYDRDEMALTFVEVLEHVHIVKDLPPLIYNIFYKVAPKFVILTTPTKDFNQLFSNYAELMERNGLFRRHNDHYFEMTRKEFDEYCLLIEKAFPHYDLLFISGVGAPWAVCNDSGRYTELFAQYSNEELLVKFGFCSQIAVFEKKLEMDVSLIPVNYTFSRFEMYHSNTHLEIMNLTKFPIWRAPDLLPCVGELPIVSRFHYPSTIELTIRMENLKELAKKLEKCLYCRAGIIENGNEVVINKNYRVKLDYLLKGQIEGFPATTYEDFDHILQSFRMGSGYYYTKEEEDNYKALDSFFRLPQYSLKNSRLVITLDCEEIQEFEAQQPLAPVGTRSNNNNPTSDIDNAWRDECDAMIYTDLQLYENYPQFTYLVWEYYIYIKPEEERENGNDQQLTTSNISTFNDRRESTSSLMSVEEYLPTNDDNNIDVNNGNTIDVYNNNNYIPVDVNNTDGVDNNVRGTDDSESWIIPDDEDVIEESKIKKKCKIGIQLDEPNDQGHNGTLNGEKYFDCPEKFGIFANPSMVNVGDFPPFFNDDEEFQSDDEI
ncbi:hypothetical protein SNEBB_006702 [Seison nebaliae]|nr:hypothetical protein SNEBB_006702 [Seison nebaliae]